ncbi:MAG TPA: hypothetical protein VGF16_11325 [Bryobacteraceae bacterium]
MRFPSNRLYAACRLAALIVGVSCLAQQGHPLTGTWSGDWGPTAGKRTQITLVLNWDGKNVTGLINPGPDAIPITSVFVDVSTWTVRIAAEAAHISAEGKLEDLGSYHRTLSGSWQQGAAKGDFKLTRD